MNKSVTSDVLRCLIDPYVTGSGSRGDSAGDRYRVYSQWHRRTPRRFCLRHDEWIMLMF